MSEKRILIQEYIPSPCSGCETYGCKYNCSKVQKWREACSKCAPQRTMAREQAIEKMAKALCNMYYSACSECAFKDKPKDCKSLLKNSDFYEQAEAGLNAILSQGE